MKKIFVYLSAFLTIFFLLSLQTNAEELKDVPSTHGFHEEINYLIEKGVISGYPDGTFRPDQTVTRGEAAIMIGRTLNLNGTQKKTKFKDVDASSKASGYIDSAVKKGIISGYPNNTFRPGENITRGDMSIILARAFDLNLVSYVRFQDVGDNMAASEAIRNLTAASISMGYPDGTYRPRQNITRAQFSAFLARAQEAKFQQKAAIKDGYGFNKMKKYTFQTDRGLLKMEYKNVGVQFNTHLGFLWEVTNTDTKEKEYIISEDSHEGLAVAFALSEYEVELVYPIKLGETFVSGLEFTKSKVTGVDLTVETPYKTFTDAIEVTRESGSKEYYVKNIGFVKSTDHNGEILSILSSIQ